MFVIDEVLEIAQQQRQQGFAGGNKYGRQFATEIFVGNKAQTFRNMFFIQSNPVAGFHDAAAVIDRQVAQRPEMPQAFGMRFIENSAESSQTFQHMAEQLVDAMRR